jgi:predicted ArsR family transcriptional regulator
MQKTRQQIIDVLNHMGRGTVNEIVEELQRIRGDKITAVTVRHHLNLLQREELICCPDMRHRNKPGRPQHIYTLTDKAHGHLPTNYKYLTETLLYEIRKHLPPDNVNVILEGVADDMAEAAHIPDAPLAQRFDMVVEYLNRHGYEAYWEEHSEVYTLHTSNCPYHDVAHHDDSLCQMDMRLVAKLMGVVPRRGTRVAEGGSTCSYDFPKAYMGGA